MELYHHGVKGMKWGVRRYQNKDGSITEAGMRRYRQIEAREDTASKSTHGKKVIAKYEQYKTDAQKKADREVIKAMRKLNQSRRDRKLTDVFDFLDEIDRPGSKIGKLFNEAIEADRIRAAAYAGEKWINKYNRELARAIDKDHREQGHWM